MGRASVVGGLAMVLTAFGCGGSSSGSSGGISTVSPGTVSIAFTAVGGPYCREDTSCGFGPTIDIKDATGSSVFSVQGGCQAISCETCSRLPCPGIACIQQGVAVTGATFDWNGSHNVTSTCNYSTACVRTAYAVPGKYTATFCVTPGTLSTPDAGYQRVCTNTGPQKCASVEFDFPSSTPVTATVGP